MCSALRWHSNFALRAFASNATYFIINANIRAFICGEAIILTNPTTASSQHVDTFHPNHGMDDDDDVQCDESKYTGYYIIIAIARCAGAVCSVIRTVSVSLTLVPAPACARA